MKKRLVDYMQMSARAELVTVPFQQLLRSTLVEAVTRAPNMVKFMAPAKALARERASTAKRLVKLQEAHRLLASRSLLLG